MLKDLIKIAAELDSIGLTKDADHIDNIIKKVAGGLSDEDLTEAELNDISEFINEDPVRRRTEEIRKGNATLRAAIVNLIEIGVPVYHIRSIVERQLDDEERE